MLKKLSIAAAGATIATLTPVGTAQAVSLTQTQSLTNLGSLSFDSFDVSLGTLTAVSLDYDLTSEANVGTVSCQLSQACAPGQAELSLSGTNEFSELSVSVLSETFGWTNSTNAAQFASVEPLTLMGTFNFTNLGDFAGIGSLSGFLNSDYDTNIFGSVGRSNITSQGTFTLTYEFETGETPETIPEPASILGLLAIGAIGTTSLKRK